MFGCDFGVGGVGGVIDRLDVEDLSWRLDDGAWWLGAPGSGFQASLLLKG